VINLGAVLTLDAVLDERGFYRFANVGELFDPVQTHVESRFVNNVEPVAAVGHVPNNLARSAGQFDANVRAARAALGSTSDAAMDESWSLVRGDQVFFTSRRGDVVRQTINHLVHHRGQLTVYLRLLDVPVPAIYGPSADEGPAF
jgi:hypothetical protein